MTHFISNVKIADINGLYALLSLSCSLFAGLLCSGEEGHIKGIMENKR